jgi:hypothetical protein
MPGPGVQHEITNDGPDELRMTWMYLPPGFDDFFAATGRPRQPSEPAPEPFERPPDVHAIEARTGYGPPIEGSTGRFQAEVSQNASCPPAVGGTSGTRARLSDLVMVAGDVFNEGWRFARIDRDAALPELHASLQHALAQDQLERPLSKAQLPHVRRFYAGDLDPEAQLPYRPSSRV